MLRVNCAARKLHRIVFIVFLNLLQYFVRVYSQQNKFSFSSQNCCHLLEIRLIFEIQIWYNTHDKYVYHSNNSNNDNNYDINNYTDAELMRIKRFDEKYITFFIFLYIPLNKMELSFYSKLWFNNPYISATWCCMSLKFQRRNSVRLFQKGFSIFLIWRKITFKGRSGTRFFDSPLSPYNIV